MRVLHEAPACDDEGWGGGRSQDDPVVFADNYESMKMIGRAMMTAYTES